MKNNEGNQNCLKIKKQANYLYKNLNCTQK